MGMERAHQTVAAGVEPGVSEHLRKAQEPSSRRDCRKVVQVHAVGVTAGLAVEGDRNDLARLGVVAKSRRIRHSDELKFHQRFRRTQGGWDYLCNCLGIGTVGDDQEFPINEPHRPLGESGPCQRHGVGVLKDFVLGHRPPPLAAAFVCETCGLAPLLRRPSISAALNPRSCRTSSVCSPSSGAMRGATLGDSFTVTGLLTVYFGSALPSAIGTMISLAKSCGSRTISSGICTTP